MIRASNASTTRLDPQVRDLPSLPRAAQHYYNTKAELESLKLALKSLI